MTDRQDESRGDSSAPNGDDQVISDRVHELTWALFDEQINPDELGLLENLLLSDDKARGTYVGCAQLHADLLCHFAAPTAGEGSKAAKRSPVLGFLSGDSSLGLQSPTGNEA